MWPVTYLHLEVTQHCSSTLHWYKIKKFLKIYLSGLKDVSRGHTVFSSERIYHLISISWVRTYNAPAKQALEVSMKFHPVFFEVTQSVLRHREEPRCKLNFLQQLCAIWMSNPQNWRHLYLQEKEILLIFMSRNQWSLSILGQLKKELKNRRWSFFPKDQ